MSTVFYPPLGSLVPRDAFPESLGFVRDGLGTLLNGLYFKDLQHSSSVRGDTAQYSLSIVSAKPLEVEVPGTGIFLVLNPGHGGTPGTFSEFPVTLRYEWGILAWLRHFDLSTFSFTPGDFFQLALTVLGMSERQLLDRALGVFLPGASPINDFVDAVNAEYTPTPTIPYPTGSDPLGEVLASMKGAGLEDAAVLVFTMYILEEADLEGTAERLEQLFAGLFGGMTLEEYLLKQITPRIDASLAIGAGVRFPRSVLVPLTAVGGTPLPEPATSMLTFDAGTFRFSTEEGIGYDETLAASLTPSQIGSTGFEISITGARLDISRTTNIPEATADGRPEDFVGVFVEEAAIKLPPFFNQDVAGSSAKLVGRRLLVGTGGLSGTISLEPVNPAATTPSVVRGRFGSGFELGLSAVRVTFQQNAVTGSEILGYMKIPGFKDTEGNDAEVQIAASIGGDGSFSVTASEAQGIRALRIPNVVDVEIRSLAVGREGGRFYVEVSGELDFADQGGAIGRFIPDKIEIQKLRIWDDGKIELQGGGLVLPRAVSLKIGPAEISITAIHFGTHEQEHNGQQRKYAFFGFDGGVSIDPGGVDARGDGIKFYFTTDVGAGKPLHVFLRIQSLAIDLVIPGGATPEQAALLLRGYLAMKDGPGGTEYIGGVSFTLPKLKMGGSAAMRYNPRLPAFLVDAGLELAAPIVLGATGLGIYGFRGLVGMRYVARKSAAGLPDDAAWWQYYKAKVAPDHREGIQVSKFAAQEGFSLGAGVSLATVPDAGRAFSSKLFFLLSLPEVFLLQGQGQVLKQRIGLDTTEDPPFFAMLAITSTSVEAAFGVNYKIPDGGQIARIDALLEMGFFWGNAGAWYINLGKDLPEDRRVRARLLSLFDAYFYLMLSSGGIRAGAGVSYELNKRIGPFRVELGAYLDVAGRISFKPLQVGGSIALGGHLGLYIFGVGFSISASASLSAEAPRPFVVTGRLSACVKVLWKKRCVNVELTWTFDGSLDFSEVEVLSAELSKAVQAVSILTQESFPLYAAQTASLPTPAALAGNVVPMDAYIDIEFRQGVRPNGAHPSLAKLAQVGGSAEFTALIPPQKAKSTQVRHELALQSLEVMSWDPSSSTWKPYDLYAAATPLQLAPFVTANLSTLPLGYWQKTHPTVHNKVRLLALTPFSYLRPGTPGLPAPEDLGVGVADVFCAPATRTPHCRDFGLALERGQAVTSGAWHSMPDVLYRVAPGEGGIALNPNWGEAGLWADQDSTVSLLFPEPTARAEVRVVTEGNGVEVTWYARVPAYNPAGQAPAAAWQPVASETLDAAKLEERGGVVEYAGGGTPVLRADVRGVGCGNGGQVGEGELAEQGWALLKFLQQLAERGELMADQLFLHPDYHGEYADTFLYSPLYDLKRTEAGEVLYEARWDYETGPLELRIRDFRGYDCTIQLSSLKPREYVPFTEVETFLEIRPDPAGDAHAFLVLAVVAGRETWLRGRSCYPLTAVAQLPVHCSPEMTEQGWALLKFLDRLAAERHLAEPQLPFYPDLYDPYAEVFFHSPLYDVKRTQPERMLYQALLADEKTGPLLIRIRDFLGYDCVIRLEAMEAGTYVPFREIEAFVEIRPLPSGADGPVYDFEVLAIAWGREFWLRGRSCYALGECRSGCRTWLFGVCWETVTDAIYNATLPTPAQVSAQAQAMVAALSGSIQPIWRPDTYFAARVVTRDAAYRHDDGSIGADHVRTYVLGWRTEGPVGHFHKYPAPGGTTQTLPAYAALEALDAEDEFRMATLQHYLDFPRCYPNADGRLTGAKPLFYVAPRLDLFYLRPYVYEMYRDWDAYNGAPRVESSLEVEILDPAPPPAAPVPAPVAATWLSVASVLSLPEVGIVNAMIANGDPCAPVSPADDPIDVATVFPVHRLEPLKLYTATFRNVYRPGGAAAASEREVHRYVFQTSRYGDFAGQVGSWVLEASGTTVTRGAVHEVEVSADAATLAAAADLLDDPETSSDDLKQRFADPFDRLLDGILRIGALPPAATTEFNVLRLAGTGRVLGVLVRSPEPFNDPKMPAAELGQTLTLSVGGGSTALFRGLHARDAARVFVSNADASMNVPAGTHRFAFQYRRWNGSTYATEASAAAEFNRS